MSLQEYKTNEILEMTYFHYLGFPYELDKSNQHKVTMIVKGDPELIKAKADDFWSDSEGSKVIARRFLNSFKQIKQALWIGGKYDENFYSKRSESGESRTIKAHQ